MKYGVDYRNFRTAIHGILIFDDEDVALEAYKALRAIEEDEDVDYDFYDEEITRVAEQSVDNIEEIHYNKIQPIMNDIYDDEDVEIVNLVAVDLYL